LCSVCVRGGSKGVPNKNIRPLLGKPLLIHSLDQARESGLFDCIVVSSDSNEILQLAEEWGVDHAIERPEELATDFAPKLPVIQHCFQTAETLSGMTFDSAVDLDATSPLRNQADLKGVVNLLESHDSTTNIITGAPARRSPYFNLIELDDSGSVHLCGIRRRWKEMLVPPETSLQAVLDVIARTGQIAFVVDPLQHLLGTVTDRDVRTALLQGAKLKDSVKNIMNFHPTTASDQMDEEEIWSLFHQSNFLHIPVLDKENRLVSVRSMGAIVRRQDAPPCYDLNASIYAWWRDSLLSARHAPYTNKPVFFVQYRNVQKIGLMEETPNFFFIHLI
jgi:CMP-N-acetylneuraminic acid synthetase